jgi:hypothetical protein
VPDDPALLINARWPTIVDRGEMEKDGTVTSCTAITGVEPQASPHILCDIKESSGRRVIPEGIVQAA